MTRHGIISVAITLLLTLCFGWMVYQTESNREENEAQAQVFRVDSGYGYRIITKQGILIEQPFIPGVQGKVPFSSEEEAQKVAELVVDKLRNREVPTVLYKELEKLEVVP